MTNCTKDQYYKMCSIDSTEQTDKFILHYVTLFLWCVFNKIILNPKLCEWNLIRSTNSTEKIKIMLYYANSMNGWMWGDGKNPAWVLKKVKGPVLAAWGSTRECPGATWPDYTTS